MPYLPFLPPCLYPTTGAPLAEALPSLPPLANAHLAHCTNYLCPHTLSCVHFPHHCPCAFPAHEDKVELAEGSAICVSKGGFVQGEVGRKVGLARKGLL